MKCVVDLSYHNGDVDFVKVSKVLDGVILREGYRKTADQKFFEYVQNATAAGLPVYAVYHFMYPLSMEESVFEAVSCVQNVEKAELSKESLIIFADFEYDTFKNADKKGVTLTKEDCNVFTEAFCAQVEKMGYKAGVYMNRDYYKNFYIEPIKNKYPIWLADYTGDADYPCLIHQYTNCGRINGINGNVDLNNYFMMNKPITKPNETSAAQVVELARSWLGKNEKDGSHKDIIDIYNSYDGKLPRGLKMQYDWSWCACTWSSLAIKLGYTDIMPIEISCGYLIEEAKKMGCWIENDAYIPSAGDAVLYDWDDSGKGDNTGWPDHVGIVEYVNEDSGYFVVIEGNYNDSVKKRTVSINGKFIRGFIHPKYNIYDGNNITLPSDKSVKEIAMEVIAGKWGSGTLRRHMLIGAGYDYDEIQAEVNRILNNNPKSSVTTCKAKYNDPMYCGTFVTTSDLHLRNDAGTNKKSMIIIPKDFAVKCSGDYNVSGNTDWLLVEFYLDDIFFRGYASSKFLKSCI